MTANPLNEIACEAAVRIGELLGPGKATQGERTDLSDASDRLDKDARHRYRKLAAVNAEKRREYYADCNASMEACRRGY